MIGGKGHFGAGRRLLDHADGGAAVKRTGEPRMAAQQLFLIACVR
jgi:hypothetical protein